MKTRKLELNEHNLTRALWEEIFNEDSKEFLDYYYFMKAKDNEIYVIENDQEICSMLHLNPYALKLEDTQFQGSYIVGVATKPLHRKKGYMGTLLRQSLSDMYKRKEPFTFLMPAAESIYTPYDFRFVYDQNHTTLTDVKNIDGYKSVEATFFDCERIAAFYTENIEKNWQICTLRDSAYYQSLLLERQSELGGIRMVFEEDKLIGIFTYMMEDGLEIMEPLFLPGYESAMEQSVTQLKTEKNISGNVKIYASLIDTQEKKPAIMVRILHLEQLLKTLKVKPGKQLHCSFAILDYILPQNSKVWEIYNDLNSPDTPNVLHVKETEDSEGVLTIGALTSFVFGYKTLEEIAKEENVILTDHLAEELKKLKPLNRIYLNEVV